jgi:hypothetical protein
MRTKGPSWRVFIGAGEALVLVCFCLVLGSASLGRDLVEQDPWDFPEIGIVHGGYSPFPRPDPPLSRAAEMQRKRELQMKEYEEAKRMSQDLVKAAGELKDLIEKAGQNTLAVQAVKKAQEIEGLTKKIESKLKGSGK